ncbi:MAG: Hsp70 family protein [Salinibacter sp.]|uniref:Hsp70 family protein n=1 Tax=Salinibacter sp. TaxID=2065818 RepID=UPI0035D4F8C6
MACIGIDFGVATCMAAVYDSDGPRVIKDKRGNEVVDAYFGIDPGTNKPAVGERARSIFQSDSGLAVEQIQRRMGEDVEIELGSKEIRSQKLSPEEIAARLFRHLKCSVEAQLEEEVDRCVITVPANFSQPARRATQQAGEIAGMTVDRVINEPTAAALKYDHDEGLEGEYVMVYDLGRGFFSVSIVRRTEDVIDIEASAGDAHFGVKDLDEALLWHVAEKFEEKHGIGVEPESGNYFRLLFACEGVRNELVHSQETSAHIPFFAVKDEDAVDLHVEISRSEYEDLIGSLVAETASSVENVLDAAALARSDLGDVVLVGEGARDPYIESFVQHTTGHRPLSQIDPRKVVALGAASQAAIINGRTDTVVMDVCPLSLGTATTEIRNGGKRSGRYVEIIEPNSKILQPHIFTKKTDHRNQDSIELPVYQRATKSDSAQAEMDGEPNEQRGYTLLANLEIDMPPGPEGQEVKFTFVYTPDGMLDITAEIVKTGKEITFQAHAGMNQDQVEEAREKIAQGWKESEYFDEVRALLQVAKDELDSDMETEKEERLRSLLEVMKRALADDDGERVQVLEEKITNVLFELL